MTKQQLPTPQGRYVSARRHGDLIFVSGMTPRRSGKLVHVGQVAPGVAIESYRAAVELATQNALHAAEVMLGDSERIASALNLTVYINAPAAMRTTPGSPTLRRVIWKAAFRKVRFRRAPRLEWRRCRRCCRRSRAGRRSGRHSRVAATLIDGSASRRRRVGRDPCETQPHPIAMERDA